MKFRHPLVLLLGGLLSASGIGCSAITAVVGDSRPAARQGRDSAGQMVAIARVFENQGRYSQAEVMYRKALKQKPNDPTIKNQLKQLADRQKGKTFGADPVKEAIAQADSATSVKSQPSTSATGPQAEKRAQAPVAADTSIAKVQGSSVSRTNTPASVVPATIVSSAESQPAAVDAQDISVAASSQKADTRSVAEAGPAVTSQEFETGSTSPVTNAAAVEGSGISQVKVVSGESIPRAPQLDTPAVTAAQILAIVDTAGDHPELLLQGLRYGDSLEAQCLAATLMGDCNPDNQAIRKSLEAASHSAKDAYLRLAISDSRVQRNEHDASTAACLINLMENGPTDVRIQACSGLRHFAGSDSQPACVKTLEAALESDSPDLRAVAAVTLGDFEQLSPTIVARLISIALNDSSGEVREAARAATARYEGRTPETAMTLTPLGE